MNVSVVIPVWNGRAHLPACLDALLAGNDPHLEPIVVDNASGDDSADFVAAHYPQVRLVRNVRNLGFAGGCNAGLRVARGELCVLLNQDLVVRAGWADAFAAALDDAAVGIVGAKLLGPDGRTLMHAGGYLEWPLALGRHIGVDELDAGQYDQPVDVEYVTGAFLAVRRTVLEQIGLLDEHFYPAFYEDTDLCWRARGAGWRVRYEPAAVGLHDESSSTRHHWPSRHYYHYRNRLLFVLKHFPPARILDEFIPAERERMRTLPADERRAGHTALAEVLAAWPEMTRERAVVANGGAAELRLFDALRALRAHVVRLQGGDPVLSVPQPAAERDGAPLPAWSVGADSGELQSLWEVREGPFTSPVPLVGRWIAAFREAWNSVATKWYVRPMLAQQVQFNGAVVRSLLRLASRLDELDSHYWDSDALLALLAGRYGQASARIAALEERLAQVEAELAALKGDKND